MVMNNHSVEEGLRNVLSETMSELDRLEKEREELDGRIMALQNETHAYEVALQGYMKRTGSQIKVDIDWAKLREAKSHKVRLIKLAEYDGGKITVKDSSLLLYTKRIIKSKRRSNAYQIVRTLLDDMTDAKIFEKVGPGEYNLVGAQQSLPGVN